MSHEQIQVIGTKGFTCQDEYADVMLINLNNNIQVNSLLHLLLNTRLVSHIQQTATFLFGYHH